MDTHIIEVTTPRRARVSLPGEDNPLSADSVADPFFPEPIAAPPPDPPIAADSDAPIAADPGARPGALPWVRRRQWWLLGTVAVVALGGAGAGFLLSPYNTIYPVNTAGLQSQGRKLVASVRQQTGDLVAPAAKVAHVPASPQKPTPQREVVFAPSSNDQLHEILALRDGPATYAAAAVPAPAAAQSVERGQSLFSAPVTPPSVPPSVPGAQPLPAAITSPSPPIPFQRLRPLEPSASPPVVVVSPARVAALSPPALETGAVSVPPPPLPFQRPLSLEPSAGSLLQAMPVPPPFVPPLEVTITASPPPRPVAGVADFEPAVPVDGDVAPMALRDAARGDTAVRDPAPQRRVAVPADPVTAAADIRAAPMASGQQVEVLNVVARLAILIRDMRAENSALKARVESTADRFDTAVGDFDRRLALAETRGALNAAMGGNARGSNDNSRGNSGGEAEASVNVLTGHAAGIASTDVKGASGVGARSRSFAPPAAVQIVSAAASGTTAPAGVVRYRVTAASPGLAMLALLDRSGGEGSQIQVAVGDQVSGYGRVTAIQQRGSSWIVQTDKGPDKGTIQ